MLFHLDFLSCLIFLLAAKLFQKDLLRYQLLGKILRGGQGGESIFSANNKTFYFSFSKNPYATFLKPTRVYTRISFTELAYVQRSNCAFNY